MRVRRRLLIGIALIGALSALLTAAGCSALRAKGVLEDAIGPVDALRAQVEETEERVDAHGERLRIVVTRPLDVQGPLPAFVLCHGAAAGGAEDRRMTAFARAIAVRGATVATPDLPSLKSFRLDDDDPARLADVVAWLAGREDWTEDGRVALVGICVGGSYALIAAADERLDGRVSAIITFGAYDDLEELILGWMTEPSDHPDLFDPLTEGRRRVLLGNIDALTPPADRAVVSRELGALLGGGAFRADLNTVSPASRALLEAARSDQPLAATDARRLIGPVTATVGRLSPARTPLPTRLDIYLLHATGDPAVPSSDAQILEERLDAAGNDADRHLTDLFDHVDANRSPGFFEALGLLRFFGSFLDAAGL